MKYTVISTEYGLMTDFTMSYDEAAALLATMNPDDAGECWIVSNDSGWNLRQYVHSTNETAITYKSKPPLKENVMENSVKYVLYVNEVVVAEIVGEDVSICKLEAAGFDVVVQQYVN